MFIVIDLNEYEMLLRLDYLEINLFFVEWGF